MKKLFVAVAVLAMMAMALPVMAADEPGPTAKVGGRILLDTGYRNQSKELTNNGQDDVTNFFMDVLGWSYLRADFTSADKTVGGRVEIGVGSNNTGTSINTRHVFGWWKVGACKLTVGNTNPPFGNTTAAADGYFTGPKGYVAAEGYGYTYTGRRPTVMLAWSSDMVTVTGGLSTNKIDDIDGRDDDPSDGVDVYTYMPRFDLNVRVSGGNWAVGPGFYVAQTSSEGIQNGADDDYISWGVELPVQFTFGGFAANLQLWYQVNNDGQSEANFNQGPVYKNGRDLEDTVSYGGYISLAYQFGKIKPVANFGMVNYSNDAWEGSSFDEDNFTQWSAGLEVQYAVAENFTVAPGFLYFNNGDNHQTGDENGNEWALGLQFRFVF